MSGPVPAAPPAPGDPAPWFTAATAVNPRFVFDTLGGRWILLGFYGSASGAAGARALAAIRAARTLFDDDRLLFFGVSNDPADLAAGLIPDEVPGIRHFHDFDLAVARAFGLVAEAGRRVACAWVLIDPTLRLHGVVRFRPDGSDIAKILALVARLPPPGAHVGFDLPAPVLVLPNVFEPGLCDRLIALYDADGGQESGFMRQIDGRTVPVHDPAHKRRRDCTITDAALIAELRTRFVRRVVPEIRKAHQFQVTRMERYIVACYDAADGGHFRAHRDNTTAGTAHRRFAVSVNLNEEFEGGEVSFPEYGPRSYKAPKGGAVVFSCSLLHAVSRVTAGRRYAFLPFLYDEAAAKLREENSKFLAEGMGAYRS